MADGPRPKTIMFFKLVVEDKAGKRTASKITYAQWDNTLTKLLGQALSARTYSKAGDRLIGQAFTVDGSQVAFRLMQPRDEASWLALLNYAAKTDADEASPFNAGTNRDLVETSVLAFVPGCDNVFGLIRGSATAPTHTDVAKWLTHMFMPKPDEFFFVAEPCVTREMSKRLKTSDGVSATTVRLHSSKATNLKIGSVNLGAAIAQLHQTHGEMIVTMTLQVPPGTSKGHEAARDLLKKDTEQLLEYPGVDRLTSNLVVSDMDHRRREEVNLLEQRLSVKTVIATKDNDGNVIREDSAVRQIIHHGTQPEYQTALKAAEEIGL